MESHWKNNLCIWFRQIILLYESDLFDLIWHSVRYRWNRVSAWANNRLSSSVRGFLLIISAILTSSFCLHFDIRYGTRMFKLENSMNLTWSVYLLTILICISDSILTFYDFLITFNIYQNTKWTRKSFQAHIPRSFSDPSIRTLAKKSLFNSFVVANKISGWRSEQKI